MYIITMHKLQHNVLLDSFFTVGFTYLVAGIMFNKFARGAEGKEMVPQVGFWTSLPGLALVSKHERSVRGCSSNSSISNSDRSNISENN